MRLFMIVGAVVMSAMLALFVAMPVPQEVPGVVGWVVRICFGLFALGCLLVAAAIATEWAIEAYDYHLADFVWRQKQRLRSGKPKHQHLRSAPSSTQTDTALASRGTSETTK